MILNRTAGRAVAALATVFALVMPAPAFASTRPSTFDPPDGVPIEAVTVNGSGCRGDAIVEQSEDHTQLRVFYRSFVADAGDGSAPIDFRKNCQLSLRIDAPEGMTYGFRGAHAYGFAALADGVRGLYRTNSYFQGHSTTYSITHAFNGPLTDNWDVDDDAGTESIVWAPCGEQKLFNINSEVRVYAHRTDPPSGMSVDATEIDTRTDLVWKQCPQ